MGKSYFWIAALLSGLIHLSVLGTLLAAALWPSYSPPGLLEAYGDSDREGLDVSTISVNPGAYRQSDANTPGGDNAPQSVTPELPESNSELPSPAQPAAPEPLPTVPTREEAPAEKTLPEAPPESVPASPVEVPPQSEKQSPAPDKNAAPANPARPATDSRTAGKPRLPGAPGGAKLQPGTPSRGGTVGSRSGVRMAGGARPPVYPLEARQAGMEGTPVIWLRISAEGTILQARVYKSCGYKILDDAALQWARSQRYLPARRGKTPIEAEALKAVRFYLE